MMKIKKILLLFVSCLLLILLVGFIIIVNNNSKIVIGLIDNVSSNLVTYLDNKTISGATKFNLNVDSIFGDNKIIEDMECSLDYQVNLEKGYVNLDVENIGRDKVSSNIYIADGKVNLLLKDVYNKYIGYNIKYVNLDSLDYVNEYKNMLDIFSKELSNKLRERHFSIKIVELDGKEVKKIELNLENDNNKRLKKKIVNNLVDNKKFVKDFAKVNGYSNKNAKKELEKKIYDDYKLILYTDLFSNNIFKVDVDIGKYTINIELEDDKYSFSYFVNDGIIYNGYVKVNNDTISEIEFINEYDHYSIKINFNEFNTVYNEEVLSLKHIGPNIYIDHDDIDEVTRKIINKNRMIRDIYNNYLNRDFISSETIFDVQDHSVAPEPVY